MSQRILVVCCIVLTVISLSLAFVMWNQTVDARRLAAGGRRDGGSEAPGSIAPAANAHAVAGDVEAISCLPKVPPSKFPSVFNANGPGMIHTKDWS